MSSNKVVATELLKRMKFVSMIHVSDDWFDALLDDTTLEINDDKWGDDYPNTVKLRFASCVRAEILQPHLVVTPRNWFEHFKQDHFPRWVLRSWPVDYEVNEYLRYGTLFFGKAGEDPRVSSENYSQLDGL